MVYTFRKGSFVKGDAQAIGEALEVVRERNGGFLDPASVVDAAREEGSPLHSNFIWEDSIAAAHYRQQQASVLVCSITTTYPETQGKATRYYVHVQPSPQEEAKYFPVHVAMKDEFMREKLLSSALKEMRSFMKKYETLEELAKLFNAMRVTMEEHAS